jgi:acyl transferase domain-containing protein
VSDGVAGRNGLEVAIVGLALRLPGAADAERFWSNLSAGVESVTRFTDAELLAAGVDRGLLANPRYVKAGAVIEGADLLDAPLFELTPREAEIVDPQHRLFLECSWEALEDAGYDTVRYRRPVGVYAGVGMSTYTLLNLAANPALLEVLGSLLGTDKDHLSTLVSYKLNLEGPSIAVQSACSSSLVAVHLAVQGLLNGECDMALAGGSSIRYPQQAGYLWTEGGMESPDGHTRSFDAAAQGTVFGSGVGAVVLKRLEDALADGDRVRAVIKGSAINNDGAGRVGYTAPRQQGQTKVVRAALRVAEVDPESIGMVEAHGTATPLGDPIEAAALAEAFRAAGARRRAFCALSSVKPNIGHLNVASGVAGLIKAVLALEHRAIPPALHFSRPNPQLDLEKGPFFVNTELLDWQRGPEPRRASVHSFGIGGTNAHVILEEAPEAVAVRPAEPALPATPPTAEAVAGAATADQAGGAAAALGGAGGDVSVPAQLLALSARSAAALAAAGERLAAHLERHPELPLADVAYTLQVGRRAFSHRRAVVARSAAEAAAALGGSTAVAAGAGPAGRATAALAVAAGEALAAPPVCFLLPAALPEPGGLIDCGRGLYASEPRFRAELDRCAELLQPRLGRDLRQDLYPAPAERLAAAARLARPGAGAPILAAVQYALAQVWLAWGVRPAAVAGAGAGEYMAACLAGVLPLADALALAALAGEAEAAEASPVAGDALTEYLARVELKAPALALISAAAGRRLDLAEAVDRERWARLPRLVAPLHAETDRGGQDATIAGVPPGALQVVLGLPAAAAAAGAAPLSDREQMLETLGRLWVAGVAVAWPALHKGEKRRRVGLPPYPFERRRYWIDPPAGASLAAAAAPPQRVPEAVAAAAGPPRLVVPVWRQAPALPVRPPAAAAAGARWVIFGAAQGLGPVLGEQLARRDEAAILVVSGQRFERLAGREAEGGLSAVFQLRPDHEEDLLALLAHQACAEPGPLHLVYLWTLAAPPGSRAARDAAPGLRAGLAGLLALSRCLPAAAAATAPARAPRSVSLAIVSSGVQEVTGQERLRTGWSLIAAACSRLARHPGLACRHVDVEMPGGAVDRAAPRAAAERGVGDPRLRRLAALLLAEIAGSRHAAPAAMEGASGTVAALAAAGTQGAAATVSGRDADAAIALRGGRRWIRGLAPLAGGDSGPGRRVHVLSGTGGALGRLAPALELRGAEVVVAGAGAAALRLAHAAEGWR